MSDPERPTDEPASTVEARSTGPAGPRSSAEPPERSGLGLRFGSWSVDERALRWRRAATLAIEVLPAFLVAVALLPKIIQYGKTSPWLPSTIDLQVYVYAVKDMIAGGDINTVTTPFWHLYFIYPPIAAILMLPLAFGPYAFWQVVWTLALVGCQQSVLRRCGVPRGWKLALLGIVVVCCVEPIRTTIGYGQVNTLLMAMVVADLLPTRQGERRLLPRGTLIGLAAAIKLTPALFVIFALLTGKRRLAVTGIVSFLVFTGIGLVFQFRQSVFFWSTLAGGDTRTAGPTYVGNQSLLGVAFRLVGPSTPLEVEVTTLGGLGIGGLVALLATFVAAQWWRDGQPVFAVALVGMATCLASPLSWTHHHVYVIVLGAAVLVELRRRRGLRVTAEAVRPLPRWVLVVTSLWAVWVAICLPLAVLPYGGAPERSYNVGQQLIANGGPLLGVVLIMGLAYGIVTRNRTRKASADPLDPAAAPSRSLVP